LKVIAPVLMFVELRLICHSFRVAATGPVDGPEAEQDASRPATATTASPLRRFETILVLLVVGVPWHALPEPQVV
jgi:hypothetical protein